MADGHEIHVHEETDTATHLVLPPRSKFTEAEREEARTGAESLEFLRKTMHDPAPPLRPPVIQGERIPKVAATTGAPAKAGRESIRRGLDFLESAIDENGAWHCIRFNLGDPDIPRHFERPPFISAFCALALECCGEARAGAICAATKKYLVDTIEYPGLWRYYRHLPQDLDSTSLCSLVIGDHPWVFLGEERSADTGESRRGRTLHDLGSRRRRTRCRIALSYRSRPGRQCERHRLSRRLSRHQGCPTMAGSLDNRRQSRGIPPNGIPTRSRSAMRPPAP